MITRRGFIQSSLGAVAFGGGLPPLAARAIAAHGAREAGHRRVFVIITLAGGNDGLNTIIPYADDAYWKARPSLAPAKADIRTINDTFAFHPSLQNLEAAIKEGRLAVVHAVGYPRPNRSHFHSMDVWQTADPELTTTRTGWLGRALDRADDAKNNVLYAFHLGDDVPKLLLSNTQRVTAFSSLQDYALGYDRLAPNDRPRIAAAWNAMSAHQTQDSANSAGTRRGVAAVRRTVAQALRSANELKDVVSRGATNVTYPGGGLAQQLRLSAQIIGAELPVHIISLAIGGFDTHANQKPQHAQLWQQIDGGLAAFYNDLSRRGRAADVVVMLYSEFGRRVAENGSSGTDHGAAGPVFIFGERVAGGFAGEAANLSNLEGGDVKYTTDFRRIYATILDGWLGVDSASVLGSRFEHLPILSGARRVER